MSFTARLNAVGGFDVQLRQGTPWDHRQSTRWDWLIITTTRLDPSGLDRESLLHHAAFSGPIRGRSRTGSGVRFSGPGLLALLGDGQNKGPATTTLSESSFWDTFFATGSGNLFSTATRVNGLTLMDTAVGSIPISNFVLSDGVVTRDGIEEQLAEQTLDYTMDYYVSAKGGVAWGYPTNSALFIQTPHVCFWPFPTVMDPADFAGFAPVGVQTVLTNDDDDDDWATHGTFTRSGGTVTRSVRTESLKGWDGTSTLYMEATEVDESVSNSTIAAARARKLRDEHNTNYRITGTADPFLYLRTDSSATGSGLRAVLEPGDYVYLYDPEVGLIGSNEFRAGGHTVNAAKHRLIEMSIPIVSGMGVYRASNNWERVFDLSEYVEYEDGAMSLEFGESVRPRTLKKLVGN